jgi:hypothetical protein
MSSASRSSVDLKYLLRTEKDSHEKGKMEILRNNLSIVAEARVASGHDSLKLLGWNVPPEDLVQIPVNIPVIFSGFVLLSLCFQGTLAEFSRTRSLFALSPGTALHRIYLFQSDRKRIGHLDLHDVS